jgi:hypothetical protein
MREKKPPKLSIQPQRWAGESALTIVHHLNERCLAFLAEQVPEDDFLAPLWAQADTQALQRAARCPVLLMDLHFQRPDRWQRLGLKTGVSGGNALVDDRAALILKEILMQAWTISRSMPRAVQLLFGMAEPVVGLIARLGAQEIDRISVEEARHLKARWPESRSFWQGLLRAAIGADDQALANVHLHCLQLLGSDALPT